jgi:hypothetical protein
VSKPLSADDWAVDETYFGDRDKGCPRSNMGSKCLDLVTMEVDYSLISGKMGKLKWCSAQVIRNVSNKAPN